MQPLAVPRLQSVNPSPPFPSYQTHSWTSFGIPLFAGETDKAAVNSVLSAGCAIDPKTSGLGICGTSEKVTAEQDVQFVKVRQGKGSLTPAWGAERDDFIPATKSKVELLGAALNHTIGFWLSFYVSIYC